MSALGIGIVTYNRLEHLRICVERVRAHTTSDHWLVVADDGSTDGTREWCAANGVPVVGLSNHGVCWNKNRALFAMQETGCDAMLLLEDDCWPCQKGWDMHWRVATALYGHVSYAHPKLKPWVISGSGTATDPFVNNKSTAQCSSVSARLLREVGFFDTRFKGYGVGHAEWTTRIKRAGAGFLWATLPDGRRARANLYIEGGVEGHDAPTFKDRSNVAKNEELFDRIREEPVYRHPWTGLEEQMAFAEEMAQAGWKTSRYLRDTAPQTWVGNRLAHAKPIRKALDRVLGDERSFAAASGWLEGLAAGLPVHHGEVVPPWSYAALNLLADKAKPDWSVFLAGAGYGAPWWAGRVAQVDGVGDDASLVAGLPALRPQGAMRLSHAPAEGFAAALEAAAGRSFQAIVLEPPAPAGLARAATGRLAANGVLIAHGASRPGEDEAAALSAAGFRELRLTSPGPGSAGVETTSVFYRAANVLNL